MVAIGRLNRLITIETKTLSKDSAGFDSGTWETFAQAWAKVDPTGGREFKSAEQVTSEVTHKFTIRYQAGITPSHRIDWSGRVFDIESVINPREANEHLIISAVERD